jgi:predicted nucleotidyltransferase
MKPRPSANLDMLAIVAKGLKGLKERVVFVGGATIELYVASSAPEGRATDDVDCVVEMASGRVKYYALEEELRKLGFKHPMAERAPICRWEYSGIQVDVMPTEGKVLGFNNRWYADGMANTRTAELPDGQEIEIFSVSYLLASKIEAFQDRGRGDFMGSRDMEDIITVLDGCPDVKEEIGKAPKVVRYFLTQRFKEFLGDSRFIDSLQGHIEAVQPRTGRADKVLVLLKDLAA